MSRPFSTQLLTKLKTSPVNYRVGMLLGKVCTENNIPAQYVARALNVSRTTIHNWFRGNTLRGKNEKVAVALLKIMEEDILKKRLPATSLNDAKDYIESVVGHSI